MVFWSTSCFILQCYHRSVAAFNADILHSKKFSCRFTSETYITVCCKTISSRRIQFLFCLYSWRHPHFIQINWILGASTFLNQSSIINNNKNQCDVNMEIIILVTKGPLLMWIFILYFMLSLHGNSQQRLILINIVSKLRIAWNSYSNTIIKFLCLFSRSVD